MTNFEIECRKKQSFHDSSVDKSNCVESHNSVLGKKQALGMRTAQHGSAVLRTLG